MKVLYKIYEVGHELALATFSTAFCTSLRITYSCLESIMSVKVIVKVHTYSCAESVIPKAISVFYDEVTKSNIGIMDQYDDCQETQNVI